MKKLITGLLSSFLFLIGFYFVNAKSGCCSWHGGVSHCDNSTGQQVCNDGTYSPSCTCEYIPPSQPTSWGSNYRKDSNGNSPAHPPVNSTHSLTSAELSLKVNDYTTRPLLVVKEVEKVRSKYYQNPDGFRERLIDQISENLNIDKTEVANGVYWLLPDVREL